MEPAETTGVLYDFLYKDASRLASYYAQLFAGHLKSVEMTDADRSSSEKTGAINLLSVVSGNLKSAAESSTSSKRIIDPHDLIATNALAELVKLGRVREDVVAAPNGSLILCQGTVVFSDHLIFKLGASAIETLFSIEPDEDPNRVPVLILKDILAGLPIPSTFLLQTKVGAQLAGTIKDEGMEEPISTYYFKHGSSGIEDVFVVGIKEMSSVSLQLPNTDLIGLTHQAAEALRVMLLPKNAVRVTPLALFRKV